MFLVQPQGTSSLSSKLFVPSLILKIGKGNIILYAQSSNSPVKGLTNPKTEYLALMFEFQLKFERLNV
jgi:hypothetical protein